MEIIRMWSAQKIRVEWSDVNDTDFEGVKLMESSKSGAFPDILPESVYFTDVHQRYLIRST